MFKQKFQLRKPDRTQLTTYETVCLGCGLRSTRHRHPRAPLPNTTMTNGKWSRINCLLGNHMQVPAHNVEPRTASN